jgi:hypothetical protein
MKAKSLFALSNQPSQAAVTALEKNPMFGMWRDREDMADVPAYVRSIRASRFNDDGSRRE